MGRPRLIEDVDLLRHARAVFLRRGGFGSTKEIARRAGISEAALFKRYGTKPALFLAAMMPPEPDVAAIIGAGSAADPRRALTAIVGRMLDYFRDIVPVLLHLMANPNVRLDDIIGHFRVNPAAALVDGLAGWLRAQDRAGRLAAPDPVAAAGLMVSSVHSLAQFEIFGAHGGRLPDGSVKQMVGVLWKGLKP